MTQEIFTNRYGQIIPATTESIDLIKYNQKQSESFFGCKLPKTGSKLDYASFFEERVELLENWLNQCKRGLRLYQREVGINPVEG